MSNSLLPDPGDSILVFYGKREGHITAIVNGPLARQVIDFVEKTEAPFDKSRFDVIVPEGCYVLDSSEQATSAQAEASGSKCGAT